MFNQLSINELDFRSIHLSNNSVQKHYSNCADRSKKLPEDNMWTSEEFDKWLRFVLMLNKNGHNFPVLCYLLYFLFDTF